MKRLDEKAADLEWAATWKVVQISAQFAGIPMPLDSPMDARTADEPTLRRFLSRLLAQKTDSDVADQLKRSPDAAQIFLSVAETLSTDHDLRSYATRAVHASEQEEIPRLLWSRDQVSAEHRSSDFLWLAQMVWTAFEHQRKK